MSLHISEALALTLLATQDANNPVIGYRNLVTIDNIAADSEDADYPATNLANPSTASQQGWRSASTAVQYVTVTVAGEANYFGVPKHNFGSAQVTVSFEAEIDSVWTEVVEEFIPADDSPILGRFVDDAATGYRLKLQPSGTAPRATGLYVGTLLAFEQGVEIGDVPIRFGRQRDVVTGLSQSGDYLGRIVTGGTRRSRVSIRFIDPEWFRANVDAFLDAGIETAFFYVAEPEKRPNEVGYVWLTAEPNPPIAYGGGALDLTLDIEGIL